MTSANGIRALPDAPRPRIHPYTDGRAAVAEGRAGRGLRGRGAWRRCRTGWPPSSAAALDPRAGPILYLSGAETAGDLEGQLAAAGFDCHRVVLYDAVPARDLGAAATALRQHEADAVLLYSPRSARIWSQPGRGCGTERRSGGRANLCLSRNVAAALPEGWQCPRRGNARKRRDAGACLKSCSRTR